MENCIGAVISTVVPCMNMLPARCQPHWGDICSVTRTELQWVWWIISVCQFRTANLDLQIQSTCTTFRREHYQQQFRPWRCRHAEMCCLQGVQNIACIIFTQTAGNDWKLNKSFYVFWSFFFFFNNNKTLFYLDQAMWCKDHHWWRALISWLLLLSCLVHNI